jgi:Tfp pilus assembly protein PilN
MHQQINLYQPIFRQERKLFSLRTVAITLGIVTAALIAIWGFGRYNVTQLERSVASLRQQQEAQQRMAATAGGLLSARASPETLNANIKQLTAQLSERTRALELLRTGAAGESEGFAKRLSALAQTHTDGLWLERLSIGGATGLSLEGRSNDADLVPRYLQQLSDKPELSGARFDQVVLDRYRDRDIAERAAKGQQLQPEDAKQMPTVRFSVSSRMAREAAPEPKS